ncbi:MAG TPA: hypothetical protein VFA70_09105, partial [Dehalococcoidia bacterium]|nr:hypothetical protein [Dehalococcoidia bacterium]
MRGSVQQGLSVRRWALALLGAAGMAVGMLGAPLGASAGSMPSFSLANVGPYGGEPSMTSDHNGYLYVTSPSGPETFRANPGSNGSSWTPIQSGDTSSGDDCFGMDEINTLYWCNLASMTYSTLPLQADDFHSTVAETCTTNCHWVHGTATAGTTSTKCPGGTSCNPFGVDRDWTAASYLGGPPPNPQPKGYSGAEVVLMYHDFYGPSEIWVNISKDGGNTFGTAKAVIPSCTSSGCLPGEVEAQGYQMCNTVPAGVAIVPHGLPHAGRIYVSWIAADPVQNATGCNITMLQSFHTAWVAYSDDNGNTWTSQEAFDAGIGNDMSTPFVAFTTDNQGNPYLAFSAPVSNPTSTSPAQVEKCATESTDGTVQSDPNCDYHLQVVWCQCTGSSVSFDDGAGLIPGSASTAYVVDGPSMYGSSKPVPGTSIYPTIAAGNPGMVDVGWLHTPEIVPTDPYGKFDPGGCNGPGPTNGNPPQYPPECDWYLYTAQSLNLTASTSSATWTGGQVTLNPMHYGDICNLGIFC